MSKLTVSYQEDLRKRLKNPRYAAAYLDAALADGDEAVFLLALRDVAESYGIGRLAEDASLNRESMYRMLSRQGNPRLSSLGPLLQRLGLRLSVQPIKGQGARARKAEDAIS